MSPYPSPDDSYLHEDTVWLPPSPPDQTGPPSSHRVSTGDGTHVPSDDDVLLSEQTSVLVLNSSDREGDGDSQELRGQQAAGDYSGTRPWELTIYEETIGDGLAGALEILSLIKPGHTRLRIFCPLASLGREGMIMLLEGLMQLSQSGDGYRYRFERVELEAVFEARGRNGRGSASAWIVPLVLPFFYDDPDAFPYLIGFRIDAFWSDALRPEILKIIADRRLVAINMAWSTCSQTLLPDILRAILERLEAFPGSLDDIDLPQANLGEWYHDEDPYGWNELLRRLVGLGRGGPLSIGWNNAQCQLTGTDWATLAGNRWLGEFSPEIFWDNPPASDLEMDERIRDLLADNKRLHHLTPSAASSFLVRARGLLAGGAPVFVHSQPTEIVLAIFQFVTDGHLSVRQIWNVFEYAKDRRTLPRAVEGNARRAFLIETDCHRWDDGP